jgi:hypothetical protein
VGRNEEKNQAEHYYENSVETLDLHLDSLFRAGIIFPVLGLPVWASDRFIGGVFSRRPTTASNCALSTFIVIFYLPTTGIQREIQYT